MNRRQALHTLFAGAAAATFVSRLAAAAPCAMVGLRAFCWTRPDALLPPDGAIMLSLEQGGSMPSRGAAAAGYFGAVTPTLRGERGSIQFERRDVGPSVQLLVPRSPTRGRVTVDGVSGPTSARGAGPGGGSIVVRYGASAVPLLAAPALTAVRTTRGQSEGPRGPTSYSSTSATLGAPVPDDAAFALLSFAAAPPNRAAFLSTFAPPRASAITLFSSGHRCGPPEVNSEPAVGQRVVLRFVDFYGRLSPASNPVTVA